MTDPKHRKAEDMSAKGLVWIRVPTDDFEGTVAFFRDVLGIEEERGEGDVAILGLPGGEMVEVFGPASRDQEQLETGPVVGFLVDPAGVRWLPAPVDCPPSAGHVTPGHVWRVSGAVTSTHIRRTSVRGEKGVRRDGAKIRADGRGSGRGRDGRFGTQAAFWPKSV